MELEFLEKLKKYVRLEEKDLQLIREMAPVAENHLDDIVKIFYERIESDAGSKRFLENPAQMERLKGTLKHWLRTLFVGNLDAQYLQTRARIGRIHVSIDLPQRYMITSMNIVRNFLIEKVATAGDAEKDVRLVSERALALNRVLDIELAIMLETYQEDFQGTLRRNERLVTLGFVAGSVNHELKNPLGVLSTSLDSIQRRVEAIEEAREDERISRHLIKMDRNIKLMSKTVSLLLDFARYREPLLKQVTPEELIKDLVEEAPPPLVVEVKTSIASDAKSLMVDIEQLRQVFMNLLQNAYQALGKNGGTVTIGCEPLGEGTRFLFADSGPGIPRENREKAFEPLWSGRPGGTGLGLAICRNIVQAHRGKIKIAEPPQGAGTCIYVDLPIPGGAV